jgi:serine/threonine protein kinase
MPIEDANLLAQRMLKLGLATETQIQDAWQECGHRGGDPAEFLRACEKLTFITPFQSQKLLKDDMAGLVVGGYRVLYKIASGSFGRVYRAEEAETGRVVAIKILRKRWSENDHTIELFEREGRVGLTLRHANIVETLAVSRDRGTGQYFIVMEFIEGGNLRDFLRIRGSLTPAEALRILEEAVSGLAHAYSCGITHRDIKLTNVLISSQGVAKMVDFGLAGIFSRQGLEMESGEKVDRTVDYAGLEKATGVKTGDIRSDIYFLGCVFYEMLSGRSPLMITKDSRQRMDRRRFEAVVPLKRGEIDAPQSVYQLVERMIALDPQDRYQTPSQLLDAVRSSRRDILGDSPLLAAEDNPQAPTKALARSVFVVERDDRLQEALRGKLKGLGFRVFVATDPARALDRYHLQPFDALIMNAGTTGEDGRFTFERIMRDAGSQNLPCAGILLLAEDQAEWADELPEEYVGARAMVLPVSMKQMLLALVEQLRIAAFKTRKEEAS